MKSNTLATALGNQTTASNCTSPGVAYSQWTEVIIQPYLEISERFIFVPPIFAARILGKIFNCHHIELCVYKTGLTCLLTEHGSRMGKAPYSLEKRVTRWHCFHVPTLNPQIPCSSNSNAGKMVARVEVGLVGVSSALVLWLGSHG